MSFLNQHKVLIVDDERLIADTLTEIFRKAGYMSRAAYSAEAAIDQAAAWPPRLAILDMVLPGMNGIELARWLKQACPDCHVLLLSGQHVTHDLLVAEKASDTWTALPKPTPPGELLALAAELLQ